VGLVQLPKKRCRGVSKLLLEWTRYGRTNELFVDEIGSLEVDRKR